MKRRDHRLLWNLVEGAVVDAMRSHPDYFTARGEATAVASITKRIVGQLVGYAKGVLRDGRDSDSCAAARAKGQRDGVLAPRGDSDRSTPVGKAPGAILPGAASEGGAP